MIYLAILLVMLVAFTVVGWPLISSSRGARRQSGETIPLDTLTGQRDAAYQGIKELDFEYELGNLSESDYRRLRQRYRADAAAALQKLDAAVSEKSEAPPTGREAPAKTSSQTPSQAGPACPSCGKPTDAADQFCWSCGGRLGDSCTGCGGTVQAGSQFCPACGARLEAEA
jgi:hypothetical protein